MNREAFEQNQTFAGEKKASMLRRCVGHDYAGRQMYMLTLVTEKRRPLFGTVVGRSDGQKGSPEEPRILLSELGKRVEQEWFSISHYHPEINVVALQMMPDHLHSIVFVREAMSQPLGMVIRGFKQSCNKHYRALILGVPYVAFSTQQTQHPPKQNRRGEDRTHGMLFARGYNDKLLWRDGQLAVWRNYLKDNPRRLLMKREHPDYFRVQRNVKVGTQTFSALGNLFLLQRPKLQVQCSRRLSDAEIQTKVNNCLREARQGTVLVSPAISKGEKAVMRAAFDEGLPLIYLQENGLTDLAKPGGQRMEACARGQLLILAPWEHHNEQITISRRQCLSLNELAERLCSAELC